MHVIKCTSDVNALGCVRCQVEKAAVVALEYEGKTLALVRSPEVFEHRKEERATRTFGINADRGPPSAGPTPAASPGSHHEKHI